MITIFTTAKPFEGHIEIIQHNAITSWTLLKPKPEIIIFGNEPGVSEICSKLNLHQHTNFKCSEYGTPLLNELFKNAEDLASNNLLCYVNADIILMSDFISLAQDLNNINQKFIAMSRRWDADIIESIDFSNKDWEKALREHVLKHSMLQPGGVDYFIYRKGLYKNILPFAIGRGFWDDWLCFEAHKQGAITLNATEMAMIIHQNHDKIKKTDKNIKAFNVEHERNWKLNGGWTYIVKDSLPSHILTKKGIKKRPLFEYFMHVFYRLQLCIVQRSYTFRRRIGLYRWWKK